MTPLQEKHLTEKSVLEHQRINLEEELAKYTDNKIERVKEIPEYILTRGREHLAPAGRFPLIHHVARPQDFPGYDLGQIYVHLEPVDPSFLTGWNTLTLFVRTSCFIQAHTVVERVKENTWLFRSWSDWLRNALLKVFLTEIEAS